VISVTMDELVRLLKQIDGSAFRLETLNHYSAPGETELYNAFFDGQPLPPRIPETDPWLRMVADSVQAGRRWSRVHIVDRPLTPYLQFELMGYLGNLHAGEDVRIAERTPQGTPLDALEQDFWMLDDDLVFVMRYDEEHRLVGMEQSHDVSRFHEQRRLALANSVPLNDYLPTVRHELRRNHW
jgi:hypothetical protein